MSFSSLGVDIYKNKHPNNKRRVITKLTLYTNTCITIARYLGKIVIAALNKILAENSFLIPYRNGLLMDYYSLT